MNNDEKPMQQIQKSEHKPVYQKPQTSLFLAKADQIQSGALEVLESQGLGAGYLLS